MSDIRRVIFDFLGRDRGVGDAMRRIGEQAQRLDGSLSGTESKLVAVGASAIALAGPVLAGGAAFVAFGAVAAPAIGKVIGAQKDLSGSWATLSKDQRVSSLMTRGLTDDFGKLAKSYEPQALAVFNTVLGTARGELPRFDKLVHATTGSMQGLTDKFSGFVTGPVDQFLAFASKNAPHALDQLGTTLTTTGSLGLKLVEDMAPLGFSMLSVANGGLGMVNALAHVNPLLSQFAITTLLLRGPIAGLVTGVGSMATRMRDAAGAGQGLSRSARLANVAAAAGPQLWLTAAAAVGFFAIKMFTAKHAGEEFVEALRAQSDATGNNLAGYRTLTDQILPKLAAAQKRMADLSKADQEATPEWSNAYRDIGLYKDEINRTNTAISNINKGSQQLSDTYGVTTKEALALANAAGVDLTTAVGKNGELTAEATQKIRNYRVAVEQAENPTTLMTLALDNAGNSALQMKDRTAALTAALDLFFNPSIAAFNAVTQLKDGYRRLIGQLDKAKGGMSGNTAASSALRQAFGGQLTTVSQLYTATFTQTKSLDKASKAVRDQLPILYALAGRNKDARTQVDALARSTGNVVGVTSTSRKAFMAAADSMGIGTKRAKELWKAIQDIKSKSVNIGVDAKGSFRLPATRVSAYAKGGPVPAIGPGASRTRDSVPAMLMVDEHVWTTREVDAAGGHAAMYRLRAAALQGKLKGYAAGGPVSFTRAGSDRQAVLSVMAPIESGFEDMLTRMAKAMAEKFKKEMSAGGVVAAARSQIGFPYSWGGGGTGGPSYGIGRGAGTFGYDCSGLTQYAWWKGRHLDIGGVTDPQWANSTPISGPRPGALAFPSGPGVHVMLGSDRPGYVIQAPHTGSFVQEVQRSSGNWRWPKGAKYATGGKVVRWGEDYVNGYTTSADAAMTRLAGIAGGRRRARGGPVLPGVPYLVGEHTPEVFTPRTGGSVSPLGGTVIVQHNTLHVHVPLGAQKAEVGREVNEALEEFKRRGGRVVAGG